VITLSAKADSFSGHAPPIGARSVLTARSEPQNILRGVQMDLTDVMAEELQTPFVDLSVAMIFRKL
jgi:hypothetical protein